MRKSTQPNKKTGKILNNQEIEISEHILNQYVGEQYTRQAIEFSETIKAKKQRSEYTMMLEIKCNRRSAYELGM